MEYKRLFRSRTNRAVAGVAGGLGEFFGVDPVIVRVIFAILAIAGGGGVLIYVLLWIFVPYRTEGEFTGSSNPQESNEFTKNNEKVSDKDFISEKTEEKTGHSKGSIFAGIILIMLGFIFLADRIIPNINFGDFWPVILIVIGLLMLGGTFRRK